MAYIIYNWYSKNRPNIAAWGLWSFLTLLNASSYFIMSSDWVKSILTIINSFLCILTLILALGRGKFDKLDAWDKMAFAIGVIAGLVWVEFKSATYANLILQVSIFVGLIPLYRGIWRKPDCERALPWLVWVVGYTLNALTVVCRWQGHWQDFVYPVTAFVYHLTVALLVVVRKRQLEVLLLFDDLPLGAWFRINIGGKQGHGTAVKTYDKGGNAPGQQYIQIGNEPVWWIKYYQPPTET